MIKNKKAGSAILQSINIRTEKKLNSRFDKNKYTNIFIRMNLFNKNRSYYNRVAIIYH